MITPTGSSRSGHYGKTRRPLRSVNKPDILIAGAGINGLVAANYLQRAGCNVTMVERAERVGGACVSEIATVNGEQQRYALGASVLGLMQDFVFEQTGLSRRLQTFVPEHPKLVFFPATRSRPGFTGIRPSSIVNWPTNGESTVKSRRFVRTRRRSYVFCRTAMSMRHRRPLTMRKWFSVRG